MSAQARLDLVQRLKFQKDSQRTDLLDVTKTDTNLIALLAHLVAHCPEQILITAVRTDHPTYDGGPNGHGHNAGRAVDFWVDAPDEKIRDAMVAIASNPYAWTVGLGGAAKQYESDVAWPNDDRFVLFDDNDTDHIHAQCANINGEGLR